jgi:hypothetical protein
VARLSGPRGGDGDALDDRIEELADRPELVALAGTRVVERLVEERPEGEFFVGDADVVAGPHRLQDDALTLPQPVELLDRKVASAAPHIVASNVPVRWLGCWVSINTGV